MNVSALDYITQPLFSGAHQPRAFLPLTMRLEPSLRAWSFRSSYADLPTSGVRRVPKPVNAFPTGSLGDRWLPWERTNAHDLLMQARPNMMPFDIWWRRVFGRAPPAVVYFAQGAQFAAHREAIHHLPLATYEWLLAELEQGHDEVIYYLEFSW